MTSKNPLEDGEIDSAEDIKNVRKTSSYNNQSGREVGGSDIKPSLHSVKEIFNGKRSSRKKHRRSPSSSSSSSGSDSRYCSSSSSGTRSGSTSSSTGTESSSRSSVSSHRRGRKRQHAEVANGKKKKRRDLSYSSSSSSSTSRSRKSAKKSAKPSAQLSTTAVKKEIVGEHVPNFLIRELSIEKGDMRALSNAFQFQLDRIKGLLIGKMVSGYYAKSPINYKVFDVTDQAANKLPAYIRAGKSVAQHFSMKQGIALKHPYWPCLIQDGGGGHKNYYPVELIIWKRRWRIILTGYRISLASVPTTTIATDILHNIAMDLKQPLTEDDEGGEEDNSEDDVSVPSDEIEISANISQTERQARIAGQRRRQEIIDKLYYMHYIVGVP